MKSEHRHELAENDLSKLIARILDEHLNKILWGIIAAGFLSALAIYWTKSRSNTQTNAWTQLAAAQSAEDLEAVADAYPRSAAAYWARLRAADQHLRQGIAQSTRDRPTSDAELELAREGFDSLIQYTGLPAEVREQALNGLAIALESLSGSDTSEAIAAYEQLLKEFPNSRYAGYAADRIDALKTGRVQEFYAWFRSQNPTPEDRPLPQDNGLGSRSPIDVEGLEGGMSSSLQDLLNKKSAPLADSTEGDVNPFPEPLTGDGSPPMPEGENPFPPPLTSTEPATGESEMPKEAPPAEAKTDDPQQPPSAESKPADSQPAESKDAESKDEKPPVPEGTPQGSEGDTPQPEADDTP